jgi:hypothetical protein
MRWSRDRLRKHREPCRTAHAEGSDSARRQPTPDTRRRLSLDGVACIVAAASRSIRRPVADPVRCARRDAPGPLYRIRGAEAPIHQPCIQPARSCSRSRTAAAATACCSAISASRARQHPAACARAQRQRQDHAVAALCGLLRADAGSIRWRGEDIRELAEDYNRELLYFGHLNGIKADLTGLENLRIAATLDQDPVRDDAILDALDASASAASRTCPRACSPRARRSASRWRG